MGIVVGCRSGPGCSLHSAAQRAAGVQPGVKPREPIAPLTRGAPEGVRETVPAARQAAGAGWCRPSSRVSPRAWFQRPFRLPQSPPDPLHTKAQLQKLMVGLNGMTTRVLAWVSRGHPTASRGPRSVGGIGKRTGRIPGVLGSRHFRARWFVLNYGSLVRTGPYGLGRVDARELRIDLNPFSVVLCVHLF